jgi:hypothetical protein
MSGGDVLTSSFVSTASLSGSERFATMGKNALQLFGLTMATHVAPDDKPGVFVPVQMVRDGKEFPAAILALQDRVVVGWSKGLLRPKAFAATIPHGAIRRWEDGARPGGIARVGAPALTIQADEEWAFVHHNIYIEGGPNIPNMLTMALSGAITFDDPTPT